MIDFGQKVKGSATTFSLQIENILLRKCTSDITAGRAVLYGLTKIFIKIIVILAVELVYAIVCVVMI